jgi:hypothetical protein
MYSPISFHGHFSHSYRAILPLCYRDSLAEQGSPHTTALMPFTLFAPIEMPTPVPQKISPFSHSPPLITTWL